MEVCSPMERKAFWGTWWWWSGLWDDVWECVLWRCWSGARVCSLSRWEVDGDSLVAKGLEKPLASAVLAAVSETWRVGSGARFGSSEMLCSKGVASVIGAIVVAVADLTAEGRVLTEAGFTGPRAPPLAFTFLKQSEPHTSLKP